MEAVIKLHISNEITSLSGSKNVKILKINRIDDEKR